MPKVPIIHFDFRRNTRSVAAWVKGSAFYKLNFGAESMISETQSQEVQADQWSLVTETIFAVFFVGFSLKRL